MERDAYAGPGDRYSQRVWEVETFLPAEIEPAAADICGVVKTTSLAAVGLCASVSRNFIVSPLLNKHGPGACRCTVALAALSMATACSGPQSTFASAGREAAQFRDLFFVLAVGAVILWALVFGIFVYAARLKTGPVSRVVAEGLIIGGGIALPLVVLTGLLVWNLPLMPAQREPGHGLVIRVTGEQWWWRVEYLRDDAEPVTSANEIRLPRGRRTEIVLGADRVIHSFWIPSLAGKTDMIPGRENRMALEPLKPGIYRGQCAEFCGDSHALMAFQAVVMEADAFDRWLEAEARPAKPPGTDTAARGKALFLSEGCGACHAVRGTPARSAVGPDLTHVGGRESLAAGVMPVTAKAFIEWIDHPKAVKPGAKMPSYAFLDDDELAAIAVYLEGLK